MKALYFASPAAFRAWLAKHHGMETECLVGFHKKDTGRPSMTWSESVDAALCFGWIDGVRKGVDETRYTIRFSRRRPASNWSAINIAKVAALTAAGLMAPAGMAAFAKREEKRSAIYTYENPPKVWAPPYEKAFRRERAAWAFFGKQPPGYRRRMIFWVMSAKKEETSQKRLDRLIAVSAAGKRI